MRLFGVKYVFEEDGVQRPGEVGGFSASFSFWKQGRVKRVWITVAVAIVRIRGQAERCT